MFILILVFISGAGSQPFTVMQEFTYEKNCEHAKNQVRGAYQRSRESSERALLTAVCVPK